MSPPAPLSSSSGGSDQHHDPQAAKTLKLTKQGIFTTAIGAASRKTLARWHLDGPQNTIKVMCTMANVEYQDEDDPSRRGGAAEDGTGSVDGAQQPSSES